MAIEKIWIIIIIFEQWTSNMHENKCRIERGTGNVYIPRETANKQRIQWKMTKFLRKMSIKMLYPFISYLFTLPHSNIHGTKWNEKRQRNNIQI